MSKKLTEKQKIRRSWIRALRSGKYKQTDTVLHRTEEGNDYFCCLGVLCELAVKEGIIEPGKTKGENVYYSRKSYQVLPKKVQLWAGLKTNVGDFKDTYSEGSLADLNDGGTPFSEIATIIENTPTGLFKGEK